MFDPSDLSIPVNLGIFALAAAVIWWAGTRLTEAADAISERTGLGSLFAGTIILGGITSLPEMAVSVSAGLSGSAALGVNNLLGSIAVQVVILAVGDWILGGRALSFVTGKPVVLLQGIFGAVLLIAVTVAITVGDVAFLGAGVWTIGLFLAVAGLLWVIVGEEQSAHTGWQPTDLPSARDVTGEAAEPMALSAALWRTALCAALILTAGYALSRVGDALAGQTGLGASFLGATLLGFTTSLPEISALVAAVRLRRFAMAFGDIFGTNILNVAIILLIDLAYPGDPVLNAVGGFSAVAAGLGAVLTLLYVAGLVERRDATLGRLGVDSWAVIGTYLAGVLLLWGLR